MKTSLMHPCEFRQSSFVHSWMRNLQRIPKANGRQHQRHYIKAYQDAMRRNNRFHFNQTVIGCIEWLHYGNVHRNLKRYSKVRCNKLSPYNV